MTWLEKFHKEHPTLAEGYIIAEFCPEDGLVSMCPSDSAGNVLECEECWMRPADTESNGETVSTGRCFPQPSEAVCGKPDTEGRTEEGPDRT